MGSSVACVRKLTSIHASKILDFLCPAMVSLNKYQVVHILLMRPKIFLLSLMLYALWASYCRSFTLWHRSSINICLLQLGTIYSPTSLRYIHFTPGPAGLHPLSRVQFEFIPKLSQVAASWQVITINERMYNIPVVLDCLDCSSTVCLPIYL